MEANIDKSVIETLLSEVEGAAFKRLVGIFVEECERNCEEITRFLAEENLSGAEIVAHRFKSTGRQFGVLGLADVCQELEQACSKGQDLQAGQLADILKADMPQVCTELENAATSALKNNRFY